MKALFYLSFLALLLLAGCIANQQMEGMEQKDEQMQENLGETTETIEDQELDQIEENLTEEIRELEELLNVTEEIEGIEENLSEGTNTTSP